MSEHLVPTENIPCAPFLLVPVILPQRLSIQNSSDITLSDICATATDPTQQHPQEQHRALRDPTTPRHSLAVSSLDESICIDADLALIATYQYRAPRQAQKVAHGNVLRVLVEIQLASKQVE